MSGTRFALERMWIPIAGGSCDVRMGDGALGQAAPVLVASVGKPRRCVAVVREDEAAERVQLLSCQLADAGFEVVWHHVGAAAACSIQTALDLMACCAEQGLTSDDLCCAMGDEGLLSVASYVCDAWCGGVSLVAIPTDAVAFLSGALRPRSIDAGGKAGALAVRTTARHVILDHELVCADADDEHMRLARVLMVGAAMIGSERDFQTLWDAAGQVTSDDERAFVQQLMATAKVRGKVMASTAAAVRQSVSYGEDFANALESLVGTRIPPSVRLAEGMRFCARLSVAQDKLSIDDMLAQDELLEAMGIEAASCDVDPAQLAEAIRAARFAYSNRFMLGVPMAIGRVRLTSVEDDVLAEHAAAWCAVHGTRE